MNRIARIPRMNRIATEGIGRILNGIMKYQMSLKGELVPIFREILDKPSPKSLS